MFRPRHAYRSPITSRYRGKAKGCPVFNNLIEINSNMVEQHDECLECLAKIKNRTDLYRTLADNNKPSNNVIKSLQRLSSSASNNRLKTCLQFLIIKVNEKSISTPHQHTTTISNIGTNSSSSSPKSNDFKEVNLRNVEQVLAPDTVTPAASTSVVPIKHQNNSIKKQKFHNQQHKQRQQQQLQNRNQSQKQKQLASPIQDQVSSTQDQIGPTQDDHDCQTSPMMLVSTQIDEDNFHHLNHCSIRLHDKLLQDSPPRKDHEDDQHEISPAQTQSSPALNYASTTTTTTSKSTSTSTTINASPSQTDIIDGATIFCSNKERKIHSDSQTITNNSSNITTNNIFTNNNNNRHSTKRKKIQNSSDHDNSSTASWSSSYASPPSPISTSSTSSISSSSSHSSSSSCSSSLSPTPSPSPLSSPDIVNELKGPRLKLSEEKIRRIKRRPILFDDYYTEHSFASTPTTSSGCSPGQHSNTTQNSDQSRIGIPTCNMVIHMFQAPPKFVNNLKPCNLPPRPKEPTPVTPPAPVKEMLNCAICGIKDKPPNMSKTYGQISCPLCTRFFAAFLKRPQQLYCAQDGDCLMTFDSRCQACWIKICLQKFDIEEEHRKVGQKYSPKLLSAPNVSLITIDTSLSR